MNALDRYALLWLDWITAASWQLAVLVCLVAAASWALRGRSPRLRHALWLLVLVKVFLPPTLTASWSLGNWSPAASFQWNATAVTPAFSGEGEAAESASITTAHVADHTAADETGAEVAPVSAQAGLSPAAWLAVVWLAGCIAFVGLILWRYVALVRSLGSESRVDEGPARVVLEQLALELNLSRVPDLHTTNNYTSPLLFGMMRPRIVIPDAMLDALSCDELRTVLLHELIHHKHRDTWVGWIQVAAQAVFWFHPLVWWANRRIRHERECVCDEAVLQLDRCSPQSYGEAIVRVLTAARGRSLVAGSMVGIFERGADLQNRVEEIMTYETKERRFGWGSRIAVLLFAALFLPMAPRAVVSQTVDADQSAADETQAAAANAERLSPWPTVVATSPKIGAIGVDPSLKKITVTFDRDMTTGENYSWTGGPPLFPPIDESRQTGWKDKRTCALPVKLERGTFYRLGINSTSHNNFRGTKGRAALPIAIYFATEGATRAVENRVRVPKVVELEPANGAKDVDPATRWLRVTFDMPMGGGMSWTGGGDTFPTSDETRQTRWSRNGRTCSLPVTLKPGWSYELGINSAHHINFQSKWGVPAESIVYKFNTSAPETSAAALTDVEEPRTGPPKIVELEPANGARDVNPNIKQLRVTFDRPMGAGMSWTGGGDNFPEIPEGQRGRWSRDRRTCILPVKLKLNWNYRLGLNSPSYRNFQSASGEALEPVLYEFHTGGGRE